MQQKVQAQSRTVNAKMYVKAYLKLLTAAANKVDDYFFDSESDEDSDIKPYFYGSMVFGIVVSILILRMAV